MNKMKRRMIPLISIILVSGFLVFSCSTPNTASVRIHLGNYQGLHDGSPSWIDRIVQVLTLSKPAYAQSAPTEVRNLRVEISATDIETYTVLADGPGNVITIDGILAGKDRTIAVVADYDDGSVQYLRYYGGLQTVDLNGGENTDITIIMGNLPSRTTTSFTPSQIQALTSVDWTPCYVNISGAESLVYRKYGSGGAYSLLTKVTGSTIYSDYDPALLGYTVIVWYKIVPYNSYGFGEPVEGSVQADPFP